MNEDTWYFTYHHNPREKWSLPRGFADELEIQKVKLIRKEVNNPDLMRLPSAEEIETKNIYETPDNYSEISLGKLNLIIEFRF